MAQRIHRFDIVSSADHGPTSATLVRVDFPPGVVTAITVEIPAGHHGLTGLRVFYGNAQLIPNTGTAYLKGTHKAIRYDFDDPHPGGIGWFVEHYNSDHFYDHTFHFVVELDELDTGVAALPSVLLLRQSGDLVGSGAGAGAGDASSGGGGVVPRL